MPELIGRAKDLARVEALASERLITIWGPPGVGKTSLLEELCARAPVEARTVDLRGLSTNTLPTSVATALEARTTDTFELTLAAQGPQLLSLDSAQAFDGDLSAVISRWLDAAPELQLIVATETPLGLEQERRVKLPPLAPEHSLQLFQREARTVGAPEHDVVDVQALLDALDHVPLAICLSARASQLSSPRQQLARLQARDGSGPLSALHGAIDESLQRLPAAASLALQRLALFDAPFSTDTAKVLVEDLDGDPLQLLGLLHERSLLTSETRGSVTQLRLLGSIRQTALTTAKAADEAPWGQVAAELLGRLEGAFSADGTAALERAALLEVSKRLRPGAPEQRARIALALEPLLRATGEVELARRVMREAVGLSEGLDPELSNRVRARLGELEALSGDIEGARIALEGAGDDSVEVQLAHMTLCRLKREHTTAQEHQQRALELLAATPSATLELRVQRHLATLALESGEWEPARRHFEHALVCAREVDDSGGIATLLGDLGIVALEQGAVDDAARFFASALQRCDDHGDERRAAIVRNNLALLNHVRGNLEEARRVAEIALAVHQQHNNRRFQAHALGVLGWIVLELGELDHAERLSRQSLDLFLAMGDPAFGGLAAVRLAAALAFRGSTSEARGLVAHARDLLSDVDERWWRGGLGLIAAQLEAATMDGASAAGAGGSFQQVARRLIRVWPRPSQPPVSERLCMDIGESYRWFDIAGTKQSLARKKTARRLLAALVEAHRAQPGEALSIQQLQAAGWPGERMLPKAGQNRVYVAIRALRSWGLEHYLLRTQAGYLLSPTLQIRQSREGEE